MPIYESEVFIMKKRIISFILSAVVMIAACGNTVFAATSEKSSEATAYNVELTSEGIASITDENGSNVSDSVIARSSISGYEQKTISGNPAAVLVYPSSASGAGGMGATIECSSSWNGAMSLDVFDSNGVTNVTGARVSSNGTSKLSNMYHGSPSYVVFSFRGIPSGQSVFVKIWIYG